MRVLHLAHSISDHAGGGEAVAACDLAASLARLGVEVEVVAAHASLREPLPEGARVRVAPGAERRRWGHSGRNKAAMLREARRALAESRYDAVHVVGQFTSFPVLARPFIMSGCFVPPAPGAAPPRLGRLRHLVKDVRRHGARSVAGDLAFALRHERGEGWTLDRTLREADLVIVRQSLGLDAYRAVARRAEFVPFGVNPVPTPPARRERDGSVLFVGRLEPDKGVDVLLRAFATVARARPEARLRVVGAGAERVPLERLARELGLAERVEFLGHVPRADVRPLFERAVALALPSRGESFGQVNLEAMAAGTPVVTTPRVIGSRDYLEDGANGRLVPPDDPAALAAALLDLLAKPDDVERLGRRGRETAERFDWRRVAERHVDLYGSVRA